jgi:cytochrome b
MATHRIWDPVVRVFHWTVAAGFAANALVVDEDSPAHQWIGYLVVGLVLVRVFWGVVGPRHARFASFLPRPAALAAQLRDIAADRRRVHLGHSPLGALMIFNLLAALLVIGVTGHLMTNTAFWGVEWMDEAHEAAVTWAGMSVLVHVLAVLWESWRTGVNLPRAMVTGVKTLPDDAHSVHET